MKRFFTLILAVISLAATVNAADAPAVKPRPVPAATFSEFHCTGFISSSRLPGAIRVYNGADDDLYEVLHTFTSGDFVYLRRSDGQTFHVGEAYSLVRPENGFLLDYKWSPGKIEKQILPPSSFYNFQRIAIQKLGDPYNNTGLVKVVKVTPQGAIAKVLFTCNGILPEDIAFPYEPESIPDYVPSAHLDRFATPNGKLTGVIVADSHASPYLAKGSIAFLNIGQNQGVKPGQKFSIYAIFRDNVTKGLEGAVPAPATPRETVGELVILHVEEKSAAGIVVKSARGIAIGDGVELE